MLVVKTNVNVHLLVTDIRPCILVNSYNCGQPIRARYRPHCMGVKTLRTQDTSDLRHFGTGAEVSVRHFGTSAEVSGHFGTSAEMSLV